MTRKEQMLNGFTEMMKGLWNNQDLEIPNLETPCKQEPCNTCEHSDEIDGSNCYECVKDMRNNYSPKKQELKTGHWVEENINEWSRKVFCSECGCPPPFEYVSNGDVYSASGYGVINKTKYCPNCGARMFEPQEREE